MEKWPDFPRQLQKKKIPFTYGLYTVRCVRKKGEENMRLSRKKWWEFSSSIDAQFLVLLFCLLCVFSILAPGTWYIGWFSPSLSIVRAGQYCDREIDEFSYSAPTCWPHLQSHLTGKERELFCFKGLGAAIELELHSPS